jgi:hypothetical protein
MIPEDEVVLGHWYFDAFEDIIYYSPVPKELLLV